MPNRRDRLTQWGAAAMLLLLIHGLGAPRSASAACNHLVTSHPDRLINIHTLDKLITGRDFAFLSPERPSDPMQERGSKRPAPCSGPACSGRVPTPVPTGVPVPVNTDQCGVLSVRFVVTSPSASDRLRDAPDLCS